MPVINVFANEIAPVHARNAGYSELTFKSFFQGDIDTNGFRPKNHPYKWFTKRFFGWKQTPSSFLEIHPNQPLIINTGDNYAIATATPVNSSKKWSGMAFGGGGYFEAELKFDSSNSLKPDLKGWPSFWAMSIEHLANLPEEQWPGQENGYVHFIEVDILEYLFNEPDTPNVYAGVMHNWFGVWKKSCTPKQFCKHSIPYKDLRRVVPPETNFNEYHKYGFLWVPASKEKEGFGQFFFDGVAIGPKVTWTLYEGQSPSINRKPWTFGIIDKQHLVLFLGTGELQPTTVRSVQVWQKDSTQNWIQ